MRIWCRAALAAAVLLTSAGWIGAESGEAAPPPRLVVVISVDQLRPGYLDRFRDLFLPPRAEGRVGGFRYLMEEGARHLDAHHDHLATETGPGHAAILTGAYPYKHGIIANSWYDRAMGKERNCVEDPASPQVGLTREVRGVSPRTLLTTTLGDELKMFAGASAKVWSISYKDRSAIFLGGHLADGVLWFDSHIGGWVTSRFYAKDGHLPQFIKALNERKIPQSMFGAMWESALPDEFISRLWQPGTQPVQDVSGLGRAFPHPLDSGLTTPDGHFPRGQDSAGRTFFSAFIASPFGNAYILETARQIIGTQRLGKDDVPDILAVGLSTNDYTGHTFGPHSPEVADVTVKLDGQLADFFAFIDRQVDGGLDRALIVLTADHGVAPIIPAAMKAGLPGGLLDGGDLSAAVEKALDRAFGRADWVQALDAGYLYLDPRAISAKRLSGEEVEAVAAGAVVAFPGIAAAWTRTAILEGRVPRTDLGDRVSRSFHPRRSGDVVVIKEPYWAGTWAEAGATHGSPYTYDTAVPLLMAGGAIRPGVYTQRVSIVDIAPTLSAILGIAKPSGSEGAILGHLLSGRN